MPKKIDFLHKGLCIKWQDSTFHQGWQGEIQAINPDFQMETIYTFGYCIEDKKDKISVAASYAEDKGFGDVTVIPKAIILEIMIWEDLEVEVK